MCTYFYHVASFDNESEEEQSAQEANVDESDHEPHQVQSEFEKREYNKRRPTLNLGEIEDEVIQYSDQSSEEDSDYDPEFIESEEDNEVDSELEPKEVIAEDEIEFLPQFKKFSNASYDCIEEAMAANVQACFDDDMKLMVGQEWLTVEKCWKYLRDFGIKNKFVIWFQKNNVDKLMCKCKD